jgi:hypothetical protein
LLLRLKGVNDLAPLTGFATMSIANRWIPIAVLLSAAASWGVAHNYGFKSGGFIGAAYVGMFMGDPYQVAVAFTIAFVTFLLVRYVLMRWLILFGRRKFSAMLLTSSMISWTLLWVGPSIFSARVTNHLDLASMALTPLFVPGLLANDMDRTSPLRVVAGASLAAAFVVPTTWWIQSIVEGQALGMMWMALAGATFLIIYWKQMRQLYRRYRPVKLVDEVVTISESEVPDEEALEVWTMFEPAEEPVEQLLPVAAAAELALHAVAEQTIEELDEQTWPHIERRKAGRPWTNRPAATVPDEHPVVTWHELVPNVYSIDSTAWSPKGNRRWQDAHPDAWEDADRWLADALTASEFDSQVA